MCIYFTYVFELNITFPSIYITQLEKKNKKKKAIKLNVMHNFQSHLNKTGKISALKKKIMV